MEMSLFEALSTCTTRIECWDSEGNYSTGTGFFFDIHEDIENEKTLPVLITNKHVIKNSIRGCFTLSKKDSEGNLIDGQFVPIDFDGFEKKWTMHPDDDIDLCVMPVGAVINSLYESGNPVYFQTISKRYLPTTEQLKTFDALEEILMIGYPSGIWDSVNNKPVFRRGITATDMRINYDGKSLFLIDASVFPGSSGSPVFIANSGSYSTKGGLVLASRLYLIGVTFAVFQHTVKGEVIQIPINQINTVALTSIPNNIGLVIKSSKILDFERFFTMD